MLKVFKHCSLLEFPFYLLVLFYSNVNVHTALASDIKLPTQTCTCKKNLRDIITRGVIIDVQ